MSSVLVSSGSTLAVAAPILHTQSASTAAQPVSPPSAASYAGGVAIAAILTVMAIAGLSAAGLIKPRKSLKMPSVQSSRAKPVV